jgi:hypothetical protein
MRRILVRMVASLPADGSMTRERSPDSSRITAAGNARIFNGRNDFLGIGPASNPSYGVRHRSKPTLPIQVD